jgi:hypothetical protein
VLLTRAEGVESLLALLRDGLRPAVTPESLRPVGGRNPRACRPQASAWDRPYSAAGVLTVESVVYQQQGCNGFLSPPLLSGNYQLMIR